METGVLTGAGNSSGTIAGVSDKQSSGHMSPRASRDDITLRMWWCTIARCHDTHCNHSCCCCSQVRLVRHNGDGQRPVGHCGRTHSRRGGSGSKRDAKRGGWSGQRDQHRCGVDYECARTVGVSVCVSRVGVGESDRTDDSDPWQPTVRAPAVMLCHACCVTCVIAHYTHARCDVAWDHSVFFVLTIYIQSNALAAQFGITPTTMRDVLQVRVCARAFMYLCVCVHSRTCVCTASAHCIAGDAAQRLAAPARSQSQAR
jgi:hypothetical protein